MRDKIKTAREAVQEMKDGSIIMVGGFVMCGVPETLIYALSEAGAKDLTIISNNDGLPGKGLDLLFSHHRVKKLVASHIGLNPIVEKQMYAGELEVELVPQGTLAERIRAGGAGLGGVLTPTGVGTLVAEGKQVLEVNGIPYLLELPLHAQFALIKAYQADPFGNLRYSLTARNFNPLMATAADRVVAEVDELVELGAIEPDHVVTPGIFVDTLVLAGQGGALNG
ncbi:CoA transferase subunit A [Candidatus Formimonas warabiya]|uniref:CoA transferase subunit A n=1 Tax=Formimonas warabiya TaxID=1761012 RepID=A0A3G1KZD0_FORW1|nr:CoA transferase subunit A [Candidatus Formimonas warabiya]ATW27767.1 hypothetical protein DCMF_26135 [Candidatus Formimonas warabiya]